MTKVYEFSARVRSVEERFRTEWVSGMGKDAVTKEISTGWFVQCHDWPSAIRFDEKPACEVGDIMHSTWRFEKPT